MTGLMMNTPKNIGEKIKYKQYQEGSSCADKI